ncbi:L-aspartate oxidase [Microbacterium sp. X-17]|uniref:L-aspartate oxidase n=1 Tax=Microbacterium sp. X-17 TaxID=3144404 RepID=UPI0031F4D51B
MTSVLVVGSGIAGITAALAAQRAGAEVVLATKGELAEGNTRYAQGGIAVALGTDDSPALHAADTLTAGAGLADDAAVDVLVTEGPARVRDLLAAGTPFDRDEEGELVRGLEAAHSARRILHAGGDATGAMIEETLVAQLRASGIRILEHAYLVDLLRENAPMSRSNGVSVTQARSHVVGARVLVGGREREIRADAVVLATGGIGQLYSHTTNPAGATGDGIAAAIRAGAAVADLEFVQFHPTALAAGDAFLVSEAVRGEGAVLLDEDGRRFAFDAHPAGELAPRDVVARAIHRQMATQGGRPVDLDASASGAAFLARRFPTIDAAVRERGLDWSRGPIPVTPAAHYLMGGIATDLDGRTSIPGLFAAGEAARTGVHGANRLASNSLLEGAVFGARAGAAAAHLAHATGPAAAAPARASQPTHPFGATGTGAAEFTRAALQDLMWTHAGLERDERGLAHAADVLAGWRERMPRPRTPREHEDANLLTVAEAVVAAARARSASVGAHFRRDDDRMPNPDDAAALASVAC